MIAPEPGDLVIACLPDGRTVYRIAGGSSVPWVPLPGDVGACWRCEAAVAADGLGLCEPCRMDLSDP